ncbi:ornithine cyclodeaminase family protein [Bosea minatitlanensis]|uniref:Ornithine cyclodeaminase family protein n=1 Tax=Bosea minatitlanensis TaxID=128782 RepID=A0ABW0F487_9HYPH|nr:ornithine cyclodeaminase family protein [Bosea minatitlanensis]MCT4495618.1 ornithine cyclodeaminase family protein [Bosea minatitlanensis]
MSASLLYLSRQDVQALAIAPGAAREAVLQAFRDHAAGLNRSLPKSVLALGPGHGFQAMAAASQADGIAALKWVSMTPAGPDSAAPSVSALLCVSDYAGGAPLAVLDGDEITLIRTAALSAAAASRMAPAAPRTIGFVGCGLQAHAHLAAFHDLYPGLATALALSRSPSSARRLGDAAAGRGLAAEVTGDAGALLARSDIVISMVPGAPGLAPFLDARLMKPDAFAAAVDTGRSWIPESLPAFDSLATDSLEQSQAPYDAAGNPVATVAFSHDLIGLAAGTEAPLRNGRSLFCFRGFALADLALAHLAVRHARERGIGTALPR